MSNSFRFVDDRLNSRLINDLKKRKTRASIDRQGTIHYADDDVELIENEVISRIRDSVFSKWKIISCPADWARQYKDYMQRHDVPFTEELIDNQLCFLIPRTYRPHAWKLDEPRKLEPQKRVG
jgi:hypothetical protein